MSTDVRFDEWSDDIADEWHEYARCFPTATVFHTQNWGRVLHQAYGVRTGLVVTRHGRMLAGGVPAALVNSWLTGYQCVSLAFSDYCQPLCTDIAGDAELFRHFEKGSCPAQLRGDYRECRGGKRTHVGYVHKSDLCHSEKELLATFGKTSVCQRLAKAERARAVIVECRSDLDGLRMFFDLHVHTRRRHASLVQPWRYFIAVQELLFRHDLGFVLIARYGDQPIAGAVFLHAGNTITYKHAASLPEFWRLAPNHLIIWRGMQIGRSLGMRWFDWGRTGIHGKGLRKFKLSWRPMEHPLWYIDLGNRCAFRRRVAVLTRTAVGTAQCALPSGFTRLAGKTLYRHYP